MNSELKVRGSLVWPSSLNAPLTALMTKRLLYGFVAALALSLSPAALGQTPSSASGEGSATAIDRRAEEPKSRPFSCSDLTERGGSW